MHLVLAQGNSQSCRANLVKNQEIHYLAPLCSVALYMIQARRALISKVVVYFSPRLFTVRARGLEAGKRVSRGPEHPMKLRGETELASTPRLLVLFYGV